MTGWRQVWQVALRDFLQRARSRSFLATTAIILAVIAAAGPLAEWLQPGTKPQVVAVVGQAPDGFEAMLAEMGQRVDLKVSARGFSTRDEAEIALRSGHVQALLVDGRELVWKNDPVPALDTVVRATVQTLDQIQAAAALGLSQDDLARLIRPPAIVGHRLGPPDNEAEARRIAASLAVVLLYLAILVFGQFVLQGVLEEKASRVVEVVLSRVPARRLMAGKVAGVGLLGLLQLVVVGVAIWVTTSVVDIEGVSLPSVAAPVLAITVVWFLAGYALYAVVYAALGATVSRQEDVQSVSLLPVVLLVPAYLIGLSGADDPDRLIVRIASLFPFTSPLVMPQRWAAGEASGVEVVLSLVLVAAAIWATVRVAGRVYTGAILRLGRKVRLRDAWRSR